MPVDIQQTDTASSCTIGATVFFCTPSISSNATFQRTASVGGTAGTVAVSSPSQNASDRRSGIVAHWIPAAGTTWAAGTWTVRVNITTANASIQWTDTYICQVSSTCSNIATIGSLTGQTTSLGTTGVKTHSVTGSAVASPGGTDKILVLMVFQNVSANMSQTFQWTPNQIINTAFTTTNIVQGDGASAGTTTVTANSSAQANSDAAAAGTGTPTGAGCWLALTLAASSGTGTPTATAATVLAGSGAAAGTATVLSAAVAVAPTTASVAGTGAVAGTTSAIAAASGSAAGLSTPTATSAARAGAVATAAGTGTATGDGLAIGPAETTASAAGAGIASAASAAFQASIGATSGSGTATAATAVRLTTTGTAAASGRAAGTAAPIVGSFAQAAGIATVTAESVTPAAETTGASAGLATVTGASGKIAAGAGSAAGSATVAAATSVRAGVIATTAGTGTATAVANAITGRISLAAGTPAAEAMSGAVAGSVATAPASSTVEAIGVGVARVEADASAAGTSVATATAAVILPGDGTAAGTGTVDGQSGPADLVQEQSPLLAIRAAVLAQLQADAELAALLYGPTGRDLEDPVRIGYRPRQIPVLEPSVTFFDFGAWDPVLPVPRLSLHIDVWDTDLDHAEEIAERIRTLLDFQWCRMAGITPTSIPTGGPARIDHLGVDVDRSDMLAESEEGDIAQQRVDFLLIATALE